ncbi:hypothetical protein EU528_12780 [Candidatus Thorarchaeota archaeon]|nr:MAG: hypothetical protein EU528_12780 [Candidatus Thorarchaeota archaeon]
MAGSMKSALLFIIAAILCIVQLIVSIVGFDDGIGAMAAGVFAFVNIIGFLFARSGSMMAVFRDVGSYGNVVIREDTGQRIQGTPCFGVCFGIMTIVVAYLFADMIEGELGIIATSPTIIAGIVTILAGIVFALDYRGPYTRQDF